MAADITDTRPGLYHALIGDGWTFRPLVGGGGTFATETAGGVRIAVQVKRGGACELWVRAETLVARFHPSTPDSVVAAAATAQHKEMTL